jgi:hypothetical protein
VRKRRVRTEMKRLEREEVGRLLEMRVEPL